MGRTVLEFAISCLALTSNSFLQPRAEIGDFLTDEEGDAGQVEPTLLDRHKLCDTERHGR